MSATAEYGDPAAFGFRLGVLEKNEVHIADKLRGVETEVDDVKKDVAVQHEQIGGLTASVGELKDAVKWTNRILIGLCLSITGSAVAVVFTLGGAHP